jgi:hypothetical protein
MYQTERLVVMIRGGLISMLYRDVLNMDTIKSSKSSPFALISMDMEKIAFGLQTLHQTWAGLLEFSVAIWLLQRQLGLAVLGSIMTSLGEFLTVSYTACLFLISLVSCVTPFLAPSLTRLACIFAGAFVAGLGGGRQARWMSASQRRVDVTTTLLGRFR